MGILEDILAYVAKAKAEAQARPQGAAKQFGGGLLAGALGGPLDTAKMAFEGTPTGLAMKYGQGLLGIGEMNPDKIKRGTTDDFQERISGLLGETGNEAAAAAGQLLAPSPSGKTKPMRSDWTAYHGSPHKFDKFQLDKIGTGEGAQAYGHGLYFADNEAIARFYRDSVPNKGLDRNTAAAMSSLLNKHGSIDNAITAIKKIADENDAARIAAGRPAEGLLEQHKATISALEKQRGSSLYKVDIDDIRAPKDAFLDWDKPLKEQPEKIRGLLKDIVPVTPKDGMALSGGGTLRIVNDPDFGPKYFMEWGDGQRFRITQGDLQNLIGQGTEGKSIYQSLASQLGGDVAATKFLKDKGIPGLRYLDAGSRGKGGTYNTVLFDDSLVKILERDGKPVGGLLGSSAQKATRITKPQNGLLNMPMSDDYKGLHTAPLRDSGSPLHDLSKTYPDDLYGPMGAQYYGHYGNGSRDDQFSVSLIQSFKGKPDAKVTIYRAVPNEPSAQEQAATLEKEMAAYMRRGKVPNGHSAQGWYDRASARLTELKNAPATQAALPGINPGDWVTINRNYAKEHGESTLGGKYKVVKKTVRAKDIYTNGDSVHEWGYDPSDM